jgi:3-oxoacyl-[acyl-carrier-protein] synthase-1
MNKQEPVAIIGVGAQTAVGLNAASSAAAVRAGIARLREHPFMLDRSWEAMMVGMVSHILPDVIGSERFIKLALPAVQEALSPLNGLEKKLPPLPLLIGLPAARPGLPENLAAKIASGFAEINKKPFQFSEIKALSCGHSAGLMAIQEGWQKILNGDTEICLAGGVDSYLEPETLQWLEQEEQLHSPANKWGFMPGEAAGFCLLASFKTAQKYQLDFWGKILTAATEREKNLIKTDAVCIGEGLTRAFKGVLQKLEFSNQKIDQVICDLNGERYRTDEYGFTLTRLSQFFIDAADFLAPADCWGDVGAASGPLFLNLAVAAGARGYAKGPLTLIWTSSESGERSAVLLQV